MSKTTSDYPDTLRFVEGKWLGDVDSKTIDVIDPATVEWIGTVAHTSEIDHSLCH